VSLAAFRESFAAKEEAKPAEGAEPTAENQSVGEPAVLAPGENDEPEPPPAE
jgi:hypothetical protein